MGADSSHAEKLFDFSRQIKHQKRCLVMLAVEIVRRFVHGFVGCGLSFDPNAAIAIPGVAVERPGNEAVATTAPY
jgi:hypothetical protein